MIDHHGKSKLPESIILIYYSIIGLFVRAHKRHSAMGCCAIQASASRIDNRCAAEYNAVTVELDTE
jgi:hypothetical protein